MHVCLSLLLYLEVGALGLHYQSLLLLSDPSARVCGRTAVEKSSGMKMGHT
jgi:hypothetical protein